MGGGTDRRRRRVWVRGVHAALLLAAVGGAVGAAAESFDFAPVNARHDPSARYALPFPPDVPRLLSQGVGGERSHQGVQHYSFDFLLPIGSEVWAAREGVVARVTDGYTERSPDPKTRLPANTVEVLHHDGSFAVYTHLQKGILVSEGERVEVGQHLANAGCTGFCDAPHLHFAVAVRQGRGYRSIPILFGEPGSPGIVPRAPEIYGAQRAPTVKLEVEAAGQPVVGEEPVRIELRATVPLRVFLRQRNGVRRDLTGHKGLRFASLTPWSVDVDGAGRVEARPLPGYEDFESLVTGSEIIVLFGRLNGRIYGRRQVAFEIVDPTPAP